MINLVAFIPRAVVQGIPLLLGSTGEILTEKTGNLNLGKMCIRDRTMDALAQQMRPEALKRIQNSLVLEAIAKAENIEVSDEKVNEEIEKMAAAYKMEADKLKELIGDAEKEQMKSDLAIQAAVDMITDAAVEVEAAKEEEKTEE